jgi:excisionase family DNA binding protein
MKQTEAVEFASQPKLRRPEALWTSQDVADFLQVSLRWVSGVPLEVVQRMLRHTDPKITSGIYGHLLMNYQREAISRARLLPAALLPSAAPDPQQAAPGARGDLPLADILLTESTIGETRAGTPKKKTLKVPASELARDRGFEPVAFGSGVAASRLGKGHQESQDLAITGRRAASNGTQFPDLASFRPPLGTSVVQREAHCQSLPKCLTVKEAARVLRVSTATVYRLVAEGRIGHARVSNAIRISEEELAALLHGRV